MPKKLENKLANLSSYLAGAVLALAPVWAFVSVWASSFFGHYTLIRLVIELALVVLMLAVASLLLMDKALARNMTRQKWLWPLAGFILLEIIWGIVAYFEHDVSLKALGYAWIVDLRYLLFFVIVYLLAQKSNWLATNWRKLIFIPALVVAVFAILQFLVLPLGFLSHFGYTSRTIFPYGTINHNKNYIRAMSFTRGANPLGAYMLVVASLAGLILAKTRARKARYFYLASGLLALAALFVSFSRSAWAGAVVSFVLVIYLALASAKARKLALVCAAVLVLIFAGIIAGFHNNSHFQNYFLHTQKNSTSKISSNQGHVSALKDGWHDFSTEPLGKGPGTSGPASVYSHDAGARNTENYYLQIGEEDGWLGLALLLAIFVLVGVELAKRKTKLALALLASFAGLAVTNFLLPAWTDITLAYIFWGLAAIAIAPISRLAKADKTP